MNRTTNTCWSTVIAVALSTQLCHALPGQIVTATAEVVTSVDTEANAPPTSLPAGAPIPHLTIVEDLDQGSTARVTFELDVANNVVSHKITHYVRSNGLPTGSGSATSYSDTVLRIASTLPVSGTLFVQVSGYGGSAVDIDNDGWFEQTTHGSSQHVITINGDHEVRIVGNESAFTLFGTLVLQTIINVTFEPFGSCTSRNGNGFNPLACSCGNVPRIGQNWVVDVASAPNTLATFAFASLAAIGPYPLPYGELLIDAISTVQLPGSGTHTAAIPNVVSLVGMPLFAQGLQLNSVGGSLELQLTNALDGEIGG